MDAQTKSDMINLITKLVAQLKSKTINKGNVDTIVSTIKQIAQIQNINATIMNDLLTQLQAAAKVITDTNTLNSLVEAI